MDCGCGSLACSLEWGCAFFFFLFSFPKVQSPLWLATKNVIISLYLALFCAICYVFLDIKVDFLFIHICFGMLIYLNL